MPKFQVQLLQHEWLTTELFDSELDKQVFPEAPTNPDAAKAAVQAFLDANKDLAGKEYRLEVIEIPDEPVEQTTEVPVQPSEA